MSRETGTDMGYEYEHWRRWAALAYEMKRCQADVVADLGPSRVEHWRTALDHDTLQTPEPLSGYRRVEPIVRHAEIPKRKPLRPPLGPGEDGC